MKKIQIKKTDIILFVLMLVFSLIIFSKYLTGHFAADTFNIVNIGYEKYAINYSFTDGRVFMGIIGFLANAINMPIIPYVVILNVLAIIVLCIIVIVLKNIVLKFKKIDSKFGNVFLTLVCYFTIFNFTYLEYMYFVECFVMSLSIMFYIIASYKIVNISKKNYIEAIILMFLGLISYQGTISAFFIFVISFSILKQEKIKDIIINLIISVGVFIVGFVLNNICITIAENIFGTTQTRGFELNEIKENIKFIYKNYFEVLKNTSNLFPKYLYLSFVIIIIAIVCIKLLRSENKDYKTSRKGIFTEEIIIIIFSIAFAFIPSVINLSGFWSSRMRFSIGAIIGLLFIHLIVKTDILQINVIWDKSLIAIFIIYGIINSVNYAYLINLNKEVNELDEKYVYEINDYITNYERENNVEVKNISIVLIKGITYKAYYEEMNCTGVGIAVSSIRTEWATQGVINYYTHRELKEKELTKEIEEKYIEKVDKNKDYLCMDDTLYVSAYMY